MDEDAVWGRLEAMSNAERAALDPICEAIRLYRTPERRPGGRVLPNRIVALAAVELMDEYEAERFRRE